jgi:polar amino acid transport system substrate-binding protein
MQVNRAQSLAASVLGALLLALALASQVARAQQAAAVNLPFADKELVIATKEAPPFAMKKEDGSWHGISIEVWRRIADRLHLRYRILEQPTVQTLLQGTADGSFDAAVAAVTVTATRERMMDFTHAFYSTGLGVAVSVNEGRWMSILRALASFGFFQAVLVLLGIALCVGSVIWLLERRKTEHFGGGAKGLGSGVWWSTIAMTQAGAAQNAPTTLAGRIVAAAWMIASIIAIAVFTAGITSTLTKRELQGTVHNESDLRRVRVGAVAGSATVDYLHRQRIAHSSFVTPEEALQALQRGMLDAFVYDKPLLTWIVVRDFSATLRVLDIVFDSQNYAIALPKGSPLRAVINGPLLEEIESDWWQKTLFQYLGRK